MGPTELVGLYISAKTSNTITMIPQAAFSINVYRGFGSMQRKMIDKKDAVNLVSGTIYVVISQQKRNKPFTTPRQRYTAPLRCQGYIHLVRPPATFCVVPTAVTQHRFNYLLPVMVCTPVHNHSAAVVRVKASATPVSTFGLYHMHCMG